MTRPALAGHAFPRALDAPVDAPYRCRCGLELGAAEITTRQWGADPLCPMLGIVNTAGQMSTPIGDTYDRPAPVVLDGQLSLLDLGA